MANGRKILKKSKAMRKAKKAMKAMKDAMKAMQDVEDDELYPVSTLASDPAGKDLVVEQEGVQLAWGVLARRDDEERSWIRVYG